MVAQLKDHGHVNRGYLGVSIQPVTPEVAGAMGLKDGSKGALVAAVVPDGPAYKAGFQQGDIITAINGTPVEDNTDLTRKVALVASGQFATFKVNRDGKALQLHASITARPSEDKLASNDNAAPRPESSSGPRRQASAMGLSLAPLTPQARRSRRLDDSATGVLITKVEPGQRRRRPGPGGGDVVLGRSATATSPRRPTSRTVSPRPRGPAARACWVAGGAGPGPDRLRRRGCGTFVCRRRAYPSLLACRLHPACRRRRGPEYKAK